jgi:DNA-binding CsgD family transcriptional regulator
MDNLRVHSLPTEYLHLYETLNETDETLLSPREAETYYYVGIRKMAKTTTANLMNVSRQTVYNHWDSVTEKRELAETTLSFFSEAESLFDSPE